MNKCHTCGNQYDKLFEIIKDETNYFFDSFECAIQALAPACSHCCCKIVGHGVEARNNIYCCAHCARQEGISDLTDRSNLN